MKKRLFSAYIDRNTKKVYLKEHAERTPELQCGTEWGENHSDDGAIELLHSWGHVPETAKHGRTEYDASHLPDTEVPKFLMEKIQEQITVPV